MMRLASLHVASPNDAATIRHSFLVCPGYKQLSDATGLADCILQLLNTTLEGQSHYPCWLLLVKVSRCLQSRSGKLNLDFRVSDPGAMTPLAVCSDCLRNVAATIMGFFSSQILFLLPELASPAASGA